MPHQLYGRADVVTLVLRAASEGSGAIVVGPAGAGRTAVLDEVARALPARPSDLRLARLTSTVTAGLGLHLSAPTEGSAEVVGRLDTFRRGLDDLLTRDGAERALVIVDDLDRLDEASRALLHRSLIAGRLVLVASACLGDGLPDDVTVLWKDRLVERIDLPPLDRVASDAMLEDLLGGPVHGLTRERLYRLTGGNPLHLSEVVAAGQERGSWRRGDGLWRMADGAALAPSLAEALALRLEDAPAGARRLIDCLSLVRALPVAVAEDLVGAEVLTEAERRGLIQAVSQGGSVIVRPAHPLAAQTRADRLDDRVRAERWDELADLLLAIAVDEDGQVLLSGPTLAAAARAALASGRTDRAVVPVLLEAAGALAGGSELGLAIEAGLRVWELARDPEGVTRAIAGLGVLGRHGQVEDLFDQVWAATTHDEQRYRALNAVAINLFHARNRPDEAIDLLLANPLTDPRWAGLVETYLARLHFFRGDLAASEALVRPHLDADDPVLALDAAIVMAPLLDARGRHQEARQVVDAAFARTLGAETDSGARGTLVLFGLASQIDLGQVVEAETGLLALEPLAAAGGSDGTGYAWTTLFLGRAAAYRGHLEVASRWFREAMASCVDLARPGWAAWPAAGLVACLSTMGRLEESARVRAHHVVPAEDHAVRLFALEADRFLAWDDAARGRPVADELRRVATEAERVGHVPVAVAAWHDLLRLGGGAAEAVEPLAALAAACDGDLVAAHAAQARAQVDGTAADLQRVAEHYEQLGLDLDAAETWAIVATRASGRMATAALRRAADLADLLGGPCTPLLEGMPRPELSLDLTAREQEVVDLLAAGLSRQAVADALYVSVRTVDSHLQRMYRKLGVRTREELVAVLGRG